MSYFAADRRQVNDLPDFSLDPPDPSADFLRAVEDLAAACARIAAAGRDRPELLRGIFRSSSIADKARHVVDGVKQMTAVVSGMADVLGGS